MLKNLVSRNSKFVQKHSKIYRKLLTLLKRKMLSINLRMTVMSLSFLDNNNTWRVTVPMTLVNSSSHLVEIVRIINQMMSCVYITSNRTKMRSRY